MSRRAIRPQPTARARWRSAGLSLLLIASPIGAGAIAQSISSEQAALLPRFLASPTDYDTNYQYARASVAAQDYEAAIAALERLLQFNPSLTRAKYELGVLYFRLKSYEMATRYLEDTLATPGLPDDIRRRVDIMLPAARKELSPSRFYGVLQLGLGYNSNFTQAPGLGPQLAFGTMAVNPFATPPRSGLNLTALGEIRHVYDFQTGRNDIWETRVAGVGQLQTRPSSYSGAFIEGSTGPRISLPPDLYNGASIHPYVVGDYGLIGGGRYQQSGGVGVSAQLPIGRTFEIEPGGEYRRIQVVNFQPFFAPQFFASQYVFNTGSLVTGSLGARWRPVDWLTLSGRALIRRNGGATAWESARQVGFEGQARFDFDAPFVEVGWRWSATPFVRYSTYSFDAGDPLINVFTARRDKQLRFGSQFDMPITPMFGISAVIQRTLNWSNIVNYRSSSWSGLIGPTVRF